MRIEFFDWFETQTAQRVFPFRQVMQKIRALAVMKTISF
jgi:hypothetical protein